MGTDPTQIIMPSGSGRGKQFETHDLRRVPIWLTREAHEVMHQANLQTRIFPQALAEAFGTLPEVERVYLELHAHSDIFPVDPAGTTTMTLATLTVQHGRYHDIRLHFDLACCYQYFQGHPVFQALLAASELVRLYGLALKQRKPYRHPTHREEVQQEWVIMHP